MYIPPNWTMNELLYNGSQRLDMVSQATILFNRQGDIINDTLSIEDHDNIIFSTSKHFSLPKQLKDDNVVGSYHIMKVLGHGGFGSVRLGKNLNSGELFALKFINVFYY